MICKWCACEADADKLAGIADVENCVDPMCEGHESCNGCDCQRKPVKAGQIVSS